MSIPKAILDSISNVKSAVITTHINPDGDAIGSALGLWHLLISRGCKATVVLPNASPSNLTWMDGAEHMVVFENSIKDLIQSADTIFVLDLNDASRLGALGDAVVASLATIVNIDHHTYPKDFASVAWIDTEACSTAVMIAQVANDLGCKSESMAMCLYTGIMSDTGSFRFPRTTSEVHRIVARLIDQGADPVRSYEEVMNQGTLGRTRLLGLALTTMTLRANGAICTMLVREADMKANNCTREDLEGFVNQALALEGVSMGILFAELGTEAKVSFRSKGGTFVRDLAAQYGGGGHVYAAGARVPLGNFDEIVEQITGVAEQFLLS